MFDYIHIENQYMTLTFINSDGESHVFRVILDEYFTSSSHLSEFNSTFPFLKRTSFKKIDKTLSFFTFHFLRLFYQRVSEGLNLPGLEG